MPGSDPDAPGPDAPGPDAPDPDVPDAEWRTYAAAAERSVLRRHLHRPWFAPWAHLAWTAYPPTVAHRTFGVFHYWWQAHVLETLVEAQVRDPQPWRRRLVARWPVALALRNRARWRNEYYDDIGWFALALDRAERDLGRHHRRPLAAITSALGRAWADEPLGGGIPWRVGDEFRNVPANGPMTILMARRGHLDRARQALDWLNRQCLDPASGLVVDGIRPGPPGRPHRVDTAYYTYNQGLLLGAEVSVLRAGLALGRAGGEEVAATAARVHRLVAAVDRHMAEDHVIVGHPRFPESGGDAGLFAGILARYLALVATDLPGEGRDARAARRLATTLVRSSAAAAWRHRAEDRRGVWFGSDRLVPARIPARDDDLPERDLSVQVGAWMLLEAASRTIRP